MMDEKIIVVLGAATSTGESFATDYPAGSRHAILAIVRVNTHDEAVAVFIANCLAAGWLEPEWKRVGDFLESGDDPYLKNAERSARETGYGWVIYDKPLD